MGAPVRPQSDLRVLPRVAREAVRARLEHRVPELPAVAGGPLARRAPVFVTLRIGPEMRGCMGELAPRHPDLVREVADRAVVAAFDDPRFRPLTRAEFDGVSFEISILGPLEPAPGPQALDPARFGIEVTDASGRRAVLLPGIEGIDEAGEQIAVCRRKAGIPPDAPVTLRRFEVEKVA